ncbi:nucleoside diphosphate kinase regulator [Anaeromyxobacter oryzisoli]|uniref:nucleoside diphosphate kinase regulator n=1 Tax=Anaeromyxobacter oryzisoli TaxID=2925408 RepID=UPI001F566BFE|nr:nucleoside diphosphate kinase regulator [Anaeromyxobacter sp. SG63]
MAVHIARSELSRLRDLVDQFSEGRDAVTAERLGAELDRAIVVDRLPPDVVAIGSRVRFENAATGVVREVVLVYPSAADATAGRVSVVAPIGAALLGLSAGDSIDWPLPEGRSARLHILSVQPPPPPEPPAASAPA